MEQELKDFFKDLFEFALDKNWDFRYEVKFNEIIRLSFNTRNDDGNSIDKVIEFDYREFSKLQNKLQKDYFEVTAKYIKAELIK